MTPTRRASILLAVLAAAACSAPVSPLATAARSGRVAEIERLLDAGADPHQGSGVNGWTPLLHALHKGQEAAALRLMQESAGRPAELDAALFMAAGYAQTAMVEALLSLGANPRVTIDRSTPLANAVGGAFDIDYRFKGCSEHTATVRALLAAAPDLTLQGIEGDSARKAAEKHGCSEMLALLKRS